MDQEVVDTYLNKIPVQARELVQNLDANEKWLSTPLFFKMRE